MKQSNATVSSRSAADSKHGVRQQRKPCQQSSDSFLVRPSHSYSTNAVWELPGGWVVQPPLNVFNAPPPVAFICLGWSDVTPQIPITYTGNVCFTKMSKILNFLVNTWVLKAQNAPKSVFSRVSAPDPAGGAYELRHSPDPLVGWEGGHPLRMSLRHLDLAAFGASITSDPYSSLRLIPKLTFMKPLD